MRTHAPLVTRPRARLAVGTLVATRVLSLSIMYVFRLCPVVRARACGPPLDQLATHMVCCALVEHHVDRNGPCKSRWLVDREVGAIW